MSSKIPTWRGCAAKFPQPLSPKDEQEAQCLVDTVCRVNCKEGNLQEIVYRTGESETDILRQVFRWDLAPYDYVFEHGLRVHQGKWIRKKGTFSLCSYAQAAGRPLDSRKASNSAFISTTVSNSWFPPIANQEDSSPKTVEVYRYEIYAPGGIWTSLTLGTKNSSKFRRSDEVAFVGGIATQYIRSAQLFRLTGNSNGITTIEKVESDVLLINDNFNPQSHPLRLLNIQNPVSDYTKDGKRTPLTQSIHQSSRNSNTNITDWYASSVANRDIYLSATFRSSIHNEAYYILQNLCTTLNYDPGGTHDHIVDGPSFVSDMFKSLEYTPFGEHGIDGAVQSHGDEAYIFCANLCALINYAPGTMKDKIAKGPLTIAEMFPFLKGTVFENGIDAACESTLKSVDYEAYLFKGNLCARINCGSSPKIIELGEICQLFPLLKGTVFEGIGVDAAYASHAKDEVAYFFKYNNYGQINVNVDDGVEYLLGVWVMGDNAPVIHSFVPHKNRGLDMRSNHTELQSLGTYDPDELNDSDCCVNQLCF